MLAVPAGCDNRLSYLSAQLAISSGHGALFTEMKTLEKSLWFVGVLLLGIYGTHIVLEETKRSNDLVAFKATVASIAASEFPADRINATPEQALWSERPWLRLAQSHFPAHGRGNVDRCLRRGSRS